MKVSKGSPSPLGATWDGAGVNFAIYSENAEGVLLCFFEASESKEESKTFRIIERTTNVWHIYISGVMPGQLYGYRFVGPFNPSKGHIFNPKKLLLDPYTRAIGRDPKYHSSLYCFKNENKSQEIDDQDNAPHAPLGVVVDSAFSWGDDRPLKIPWNETIIYETHLKGFTAMHPDVDESLRGTYLGFASDPVLDYLKKLGINTIEFLPVQHFIPEHDLVKKGLTNYWGYNTLAFFAPSLHYSSGSRGKDALQEFKIMVRTLHKAGFEVILDVVYNHTAEGDHNGPTLSLKGIDNKNYYRLMSDNPLYYEDFTGCGNTLNMTNPFVLQLIMDSLRYWITEMHIDGFRFDLASALARELHDVDKLGAFFDIIQQDPLISQVKLIAEPWDLGEGGYQVGKFPSGWAEWNGKYRDRIRHFWNRSDHNIGKVATRLAGSSDLYGSEDRKPHASINFITCHDGFTLRDLVSYSEKHNEANLWNNTDGTDNNISYNCGIEGDTDDLDIIYLRLKQQKNLLTSLFVSQGVPMILAGDEINRTQKGNNNPYCQDNDTNYMNWELDDRAEELLSFTGELIKLLKGNEVLRRASFFRGEHLHETGMKDILWIHPSGREMNDDDWNSNSTHCLGMLLPARPLPHNDTGNDTLFVIFNASVKNIEFKLPKFPVLRWFLRLGTADNKVVIISRDESYDLEAQSIAIFQPERRKGDRRQGGMAGVRESRTISIRGAVNRLAEFYGILGEFTDLSGCVHALSTEQKQRVLEAMGIQMDSEETANRALIHAKTSVWYRYLDPAFVMKVSDEKHVIDLHIPEKKKADYSISILLENDDGEYNYPLSDIDCTIVEKKKIDDTGWERLKLSLPEKLPEGYHLLKLNDGPDSVAESRLVAVPDTAFLRDDFYERKEKGIAVQLYALRSKRNLGIGDFSDLSELGKVAAETGFSVIGISPIHALFMSRPERHSPYYPSNRRQLHPAYLDIFSIPEWVESEHAQKIFDSEEFQKWLKEEKKNEIIDYDSVYQRKLQILGILYADFIRIHGNKKTSRWNDFVEFKKREGRDLFLQALYDTADEVYAPIGLPGDILDEQSDNYRKFLELNGERVDFFIYLYWNTVQQFEQLVVDLRACGISLYVDLAVGSAPDGAEVMTAPDVYAQNARAGAPPDPFSPSGQNWGLAVWSPHRLKKMRYEPYIRLLRANMTENGIIRIDHAMMLFRLYWQIEGGDALGAYMQYPHEDLLGILALESRRKKCAVIGEDLGTVPGEIKHELQRHNILSWKVLYFEKNWPDPSFLGHEGYPSLSVATVNTHDLPTLCGFWADQDISERVKLNLLGDDNNIENVKRERARDRLELMRLVSDGDFNEGENPPEKMTPELAAKLHAFLMKTRCGLVLISMHDLIGELKQPNLPGTVEEYPCWKMRHSVSLEELKENSFFKAISNAIQISE